MGHTQKSSYRILTLHDMKSMRWQSLAQVVSCGGHGVMIDFSHKHTHESILQRELVGFVASAPDIGFESCLLELAPEDQGTVYIALDAEPNVGFVLLPVSAVLVTDAFCFATRGMGVALLLPESTSGPIRRAAEHWRLRR